MYKQKMSDLINAITDGGQKRDEDTLFILDATLECMHSFVDYVSSVYNMESRIQVARFHCEGQEFRDIVTELDNQRRISHEAAISNLNMLNRISNSFGIGPIYDTENKNRTDIGDFCGDFVKEYFDDRDSRTITRAEFDRFAKEEFGVER